MNEGKEHEQWFARCASLGWTREEGPDGADSVTSPRGTSIRWDSDKRVFRCKKKADADFSKLVRTVIAQMNSCLHDNRKRINEIRLATRELERVLDDRKFDPALVDDWRDAGSGRKTLVFDIGPLSVTAYAADDGKWSVEMTNGQLVNRASGKDESFADARLRVYGKLMDWCDELADTGRYAVKVYTKVKTAAE